MVKGMVVVFIPLRMERYMKMNGQMISCMAMVFTLVWLVIVMKVDGKMVKR